MLPTVAGRPDVVDDKLTVNENEGPVCVDVLENDTPPEGQTLLVTEVTGGDNGVCSISPDSTEVCYMPDKGFTGLNSCEYMACDDQDPPQCGMAIVTINVLPNCGNEVCDNGEDCNTCPGDCGVCPPPTSSPTASCGNGVCDNGEDCNTCPGDCGACPPPTSSPTAILTGSPSPPMICQMEVGSTVEFWFNITGLTIESLIEGTNNFAKPPDLVEVFPDRLEIPPNRKDPTTGKDVDNYGVRMKGFIVAEETGPHTFWIASDDNGQFSMSPNRFRGGLKELCNVTTWVTCTECWDVYPEQKSLPVDLVKGEYYYYEVSL